MKLGLDRQNRTILPVDIDWLTAGSVFARVLNRDRSKAFGCLLSNIPVRECSIAKALNEQIQMDEKRAIRTVARPGNG
jgi:hypothetical protein